MNVTAPGVPSLCCSARSQDQFRGGLPDDPPKIRSDTMTTATLRLFTPLAPARTAPKRKNALVRFYNALMEARMRQAMRELAMHRHLWPLETVKPMDVVPQDEVKRAGYKATYADAALLPFVR